jgi:hypothetical protein
VIYRLLITRLLDERIPWHTASSASMYVSVREFSYFWTLYRTKFEQANFEQAQL